MDPGRQFETMYHITDDPKFTPKADQVPSDNAFALHERTAAGIYLTPNPESWVNGHGYVRPFVAEVHVPKGVGHPGRWGDEHFVHGDEIHRLKVNRVIPLDAHAREEYGSPGWIEKHHGTTFDTGEKIKPAGFNSTSAEIYPYRGYKYPGPDTRDMSPAEVQRHRQRTEQFNKTREVPSW